MATERYQISLYAENLPNKGWFRRSSPYAVVKVTSGPHAGKELGETEVIQRCLSPDWCKIFILEFSESEITNIEVTIYDHRDGKEPLYMGEARFEATSVYQSEGRTRDRTIGRNDRSK